MTSNVQELERAFVENTQAKAALVEAIREARAAGMSLRAIAALVGLSPESVRKLSI